MIAAGDLMASTTEDADAAAERLEAALERIARRAAVMPQPETELAQVRAQLDVLIARLRAALEPTS